MVDNPAAPEAPGSEGGAHAPWPFPRRFIAVFTSPRALFENLSLNPSWFAPFAAALGVVLLYVVVLWRDVTLPETIERMEETGQASDQAVAMIESSGIAFGVVGAVVGTVVAVLVLATIVLLLAGFVLGGRLTFRTSLSIVTHAGLVSVPALLLRIPLAFAAKTSQVTIGPGAFFPPGQAEGFGGRLLAFFLTGLDLFTLWQMALIALGVSVVGRLALPRAAVAIGIGFVVFTLLGALLGAALSR